MGIRLRLLSLAALAAALVSCAGPAPSGRPTIPYVEKILADKASPEYVLLSSIPAGKKEGRIAIIDSPDRSAALLEEFLGSDHFDNINGSAAPDRLPDFAGETVVSLLDEHNTPFTNFLGNTETLREVTVREALKAFGPDVDAKALVLSSSLMAQFGGFDLDTLLRSTGVAVPVILPIVSIADRCRAAAAPGKVAVFAEVEGMAGTGVYEALFAGVDCFSGFVADTVETGASLRALLRAYRASGATGAISLFCIDDFRLSPEDIAAQAREIIEVESEENLHLRQLIARDWRVVDVLREASEACYREFRKRNVFTHDIAYPKGLTLNVQD